MNQKPIDARMRLLNRMHAVIAFDRQNLGDKREMPKTLAAAFGGLNAAQFQYLRTMNEYARLKGMRA